MSGMIKSIGKAFKAVGKFVKKIALPVLAIGLVVLTGGAALGLLPAIAGVGGIGASLGLSTALTGILSTAATSATIGAGVSLITGGDPIKGATMGMLTGGALGGIGALAGGGAGAASGAASAGSQAASGAAVGTIDGIAPLATSAVPVASTVAAPVAAAAPTGIGAMISGASNVVKPALSFLNNNPIVAGGLIQGIGAGISANAQSADARKERERIEGNYSGIGDSLYGAAPTVRYDQPYTYDTKTGRVIVGGRS